MFFSSPSMSKKLSVSLQHYFNPIWDVVQSLQSQHKSVYEAQLNTAFNVKLSVITFSFCIIKQLQCMTMYKHHNSCENILDSSLVFPSSSCLIESSTLSEHVNQSRGKHSKTATCQYNIRYYHKGMNVFAPNQDMDVRYLGFHLKS
jgi:hypothetical protein